MNKAIFLDRDGTINVDKGYLYKIEDFEWLPGALEGLRLLGQMGYKIIIVTNQSGIARGYYTESDFKTLNKWMLDFLEDQQVPVEKVYYCPHLPDAKIAAYRKNCNCRKPGLGMYQQAIAELNIDLKMSFAIGDKFRDCRICTVSECKGFLIGNKESHEVIADIEKGMYGNLRYRKNLLECAHTIFEENKI